MNICGRTDGERADYATARRACAGTVSYDSSGSSPPALSTDAPVTATDNVRETLRQFIKVFLAFSSIGISVRDVKLLSRIILIINMC